MRIILALVLSSALALAGELRVASYNIRFDAKNDRGAKDWSQRMPGVVKFMTERRYSIIGLQEVLVNQLEDLKKGNPKLKQLGVGRDDGKTMGEYAPLFYDPEVWTADEEEQGTFWLSETPESPRSKSWGNAITRICTWARMIGKDGNALYVFNTHWDHKSENFREKAALLILARMKARENSNEPVILMGDFNTSTKSVAIQSFLTEGLLVDHGGEDQKLSFNRWEPGLKAGARIDHIFTSPSIKKAQFMVLADGDPVNSDHHPVELIVKD